ncbi:MAG: hypothetical protein ACC707_20650 [Thiohalomonadales bacterium]
MLEREPTPETEEILLHNPDEPFISSIDSPQHNLTIRFIQSDRSNLESKNFSIYDNKYLAVSSFKNNIKQQYWLNLRFISPQSQRKFIINRLWLWLTGLLIGISALAHYTTWIDQIPTVTDYRQAIITISLTSAFITIITLFAKARSVVYLSSTYGDIPLVEILHNNPNKLSYNQFLIQITNSIRSATNHEDIDLPRRLAAELKEHRRLRDNGIISHENYTSAKERIFSLQSR